MVGPWKGLFLDIDIHEEVGYFATAKASNVVNVRLYMCRFVLCLSMTHIEQALLPSHVSRITGQIVLQA